MEDSSLLGPVIKAWFKSNDWPQSVSEGLARAKGWTAGPWASQISICMSGRLTPKPNFFLSLGMFNQAVAERDFVGVTDRRLMDRLKAGQPICHEDGVPWTAMDFFGCYIGAVQPPKSLSEPAEVVTQEDVNQWARDLREVFHSTVLDLMLPARDVWQLIEDKSIREKGMAKDDLDWLREVVTGLIEPQLEPTLRQCVKYPSDQFESACVEVCKGEVARGKAEALRQFVMSKKALMPPMEKQWPQI